MAPVINGLDEDPSARIHRDFLAGMLEQDFANRRLATIMLVPLVGCASHRLNRAVQQHMTQNENDFAAVQGLMTKLRTIKHPKASTTLRPVIRQDILWGSTFSMVHRYFALLEFLDQDDEELMYLLPCPAYNRQLKKLYADFKDFESVLKALQGENVSLLDVRVWFDGLIEAQPAFAAYIAPRANIVHTPDFELGCVRVLKGNGARLTASEKRALRPFLQVDRAPVNHGEEAETDSLVQRLEKRRRLEA
ncbi:hypothetical protein F443_20225 [Phytophthora nicotianae P1569]|uniref:Uncharacterized protein n=1 Tax=Phytophthora nicotianae P1569 TaxID=1317065 RepID=V9E1S0_PHYNI|nr:hypothetical protein F443_20225 [Phytophthora nicotianae P1569]